MGDDNEYEVEAIHRAKVAKIPKARKKCWLYYVKWKGYDLSDNTWEPVESFSGGSEHFVCTFWQRVNTNGRDWEDISNFQENEELFPTGPPRRLKKDVKEPSDTSADRSNNSEIEVRSMIGDEDRPKEKRRASETLEASTGKRRRGRKSEMQEEPETPPRMSMRRKRSMPDINVSASGQGNKARSSKGKTGPEIPSASTSKRRKQGTGDGPAPEEQWSKGRSRKSDSRAEDLANATLDEPTAAGVSVFGIPILLQGFDEHPATSIHTEAEAEAAPAMPAHRARAANPRVKVFDDPLEASGSAIPAKERIMRQNGGGTQPTQGTSTFGPTRNATRASKAKAGPGRNSAGLITGSTSLLTVEKGTLKSVKGKALPTRKNKEEKQEVVDAPMGEPEAAEPLVPVPPPTGEELLSAAGYNAASAQDLPDFEDDIDAHGEPDPDHPQPPESTANEVQKASTEQASADAQANVVEPKQEEIAVEQPIEGPKLVLASASGPSFSGWRLSTIFGPMGIGREQAPVHQENQVAETNNDSPVGSSGCLFLSLDNATCVPVRLKDINPPGSYLEAMETQLNAGPPGKFYKGEHALRLLETFRMDGSSARLVLGAAADDAHKLHFTRFCSRLHAGELFVEMIGVKILAIVSSEDRALGERMAVPVNLLGLSETILVVQVSIENYSAYANAVVHADDVQWSAIQ